jgi:hypothetical protein
MDQMINWVTAANLIIDLLVVAFLARSGPGDGFRRGALCWIGVMALAWGWLLVTEAVPALAVREIRATVFRTLHLVARLGGIGCVLYDRRGPR